MVAYEKILEAAARLFMAKGFHGASIKDIASIAGVNSAMISYYFQSKENVFIQLLKTTVEALQAIYTDAGKFKNKKQRLYAFYTSTYDYCKQNETTVPLYNQQPILSGYPRIQKQYDSLFNTYKKAFYRLMEIDSENGSGQENTRIGLGFLAITGFINSVLTNSEAHKDEDVYHYIKHLIDTCF